MSKRHFTEVSLSFWTSHLEKGSETSFHTLWTRYFLVHCKYPWPLFLGWVSLKSTRKLNFYQDGKEHCQTIQLHPVSLIKYQDVGEMNTNNFENVLIGSRLTSIPAHFPPHIWQVQTLLLSQSASASSGFKTSSTRIPALTQNLTVNQCNRLLTLP